MKNLSQAKYEDGNGHEVDASMVDVLAPYKFIADGFYTWTCGACGEEHNDRWHSPSGRVLVCQKGSPAFGSRPEEGCGKRNLLVRTNCTEISESLSGKWQATDEVKEAKRLLGIQEHNEEALQQLRHKILTELEQMLAEAVTRAGRQ
jgi:hypothetical protein